MTDATYRKASHRDRHDRQKGGRGRLTGWTKGGVNTKRCAVSDTKGRPIRFSMTAGQVSDSHRRSSPYGRSASSGVAAGPGL